MEETKDSNGIVGSTEGRKDERSEKTWKKLILAEKPGQHFNTKKIWAIEDHPAHTQGGE